MVVDRRLKILSACLGLAVVFVTYVGWKLFLFTVDDAYIAFRYAANSLAGHGLTWNPPPFRPVEGYSSFLWVILLREVWRVFGVEPPVVANYISLLFGYATLFLGYKFLARMRLPPPLASRRWTLLALVMLGTITNRTFLTWLSSGLETSLFNFLFTWWIYIGTTDASDRSAGWGVRLSFAATLLALTRPDGLLAVAATPVILVAADVGRVADGTNPRQRARGLMLTLFGGWPLIGVVIHFAWRRWTYGEWLPNTYYAKHVAPWPESGVRYVAAFVVEYGIWVWLGLVVTLLAAIVWRSRSEEASTPSSRGRWDALIQKSPAIITVGVVIAHFVYYTFRIGGDHFEYRVYSHLVLLLFVSTVWLLGWLVRCLPDGSQWGFRVALGVMLLFIVSSYPIPWSHWAQTRGLEKRRQTLRLTQPLSPSFPSVFRPIVAHWDEWQAWLIDHSVCMRHQEHKVFSEFQKTWLPERGKSKLKLEGQGQPVVVEPLVGVLGWALPEVAVIDTLGLNDYVIARNPDLRIVEERVGYDPERGGHGRQMAHDRQPPDGYLECFRPNVFVFSRAGLYSRARSEPLTDAEIISCESQKWY